MASKIQTLKDNKDNKIYPNTLKEAIYNKSGIPLTTEMKELTSRMDTFTNLPEGSTSGDAELMDVRVGITGEIYDSAGTAVREQIKDIKANVVECREMERDIKAQTQILNTRVDNIVGKPEGGGIAYDLEILDARIKTDGTVAEKLGDAVREQITELSEAVNNLENHVANKSNPHEVTKEQVGLGNVDNTSDADKPVSTAQRNAIDEAYANSNYYTDEKIADLIGGAPSTLDTLKEISDAMAEHEEVVAALDQAIGSKANESEFNSHVTNTSNPHGVTKSQVGLGNVPNVTTNDQTPTYTEASATSALTSGEKLSIAFGKIAKAISSLISHLSNKSNPHGVTKSQVGLGNVDNTSDANKPISTATQAALDQLNSNLNNKAASNHTHAGVYQPVGNYVTTDNTKNIEWSGSIGYDATGYLAAFNDDGTKLKALSKSVFAPASHTHNYLPLSGGTVTGATQFNNYLLINAWPGYGSGAAGFWYNGNGSCLEIENAKNLKLGGTYVSKEDHTHSEYAAASHNHKYVIDNKNSNNISFSYSNSGLAYNEYSWLAAWNGYEIRAVEKSQFAASSHSHSLSSITGGNPLIKAVDVSVTATTKAGTYSNHSNISAPTPDGYSFIGCYIWNHGHPKRHYHYCYQGNPTEVVLHNYSMGDITEPITIRFLFVKNI